MPTPYCGLKNAPTNGGTRAGPCSKQWRRFGRDVVANDRLDLIQTFLAPVATVNGDNPPSAYCGAKPTPPSHNKPLASIQKQCEKTHQLRMWGRIPTADGLEIRTYEPRDSHDLSGLPALFRVDEGGNATANAAKSELVRQASTALAHANFARGEDRGGDHATHKSGGELVVAYAFVPNRRVATGNLSPKEDLPVGWAIARLAAPGVADCASLGACRAAEDRQASGGVQPPAAWTTVEQDLGAFRATVLRGDALKLLENDRLLNFFRVRTDEKAGGIQSIFLGTTNNVDYKGERFLSLLFPPDADIKKIDPYQAVAVAFGVKVPNKKKKSAILNIIHLAKTDIDGDALSARDATTGKRRWGWVGLTSYQDRSKTRWKWTGGKNLTENRFLTAMKDGARTRHLPFGGTPNPLVLKAHIALLRAAGVSQDECNIVKQAPGLDCVKVFHKDKNNQSDPGVVLAYAALGYWHDGQPGSSFELRQREGRGPMTQAEEGWKHMLAACEQGTWLFAPPSSASPTSPASASSSAPPPLPAVRTLGWRALLFSIYVIPTYTVHRDASQQTLAHRLLDALEAAVTHRVSESEGAQLLEDAGAPGERNDRLELRTLGLESLNGLRDLFEARNFQFADADGGHAVKSWRVVKQVRRDEDDEQEPQEAQEPQEPDEPDEPDDGHADEPDDGRSDNGTDDLEGNNPDVSDLDDKDVSYITLRFDVPSELGRFRDLVTHDRAKRLCFVHTLLRNGDVHLFNALSNSPDNWERLAGPNETARGDRRAIVAMQTQPLDVAVGLIVTVAHTETASPQINFLYNNQTEPTQGNLFGPGPDNVHPHVSGLTTFTYLRKVAAFWRGQGAGFKIHEIDLLCGSRQGAGLLQKAIEGLPDTDVLYVTAAHDDGVEYPLWKRVYQDKYGFHVVPGLLVREAKTLGVPLVAPVGDLRAQLGASGEFNAYARMKLQTPITGLNGKDGRPRPLAVASFPKLEHNEISNAMMQIAKEHPVFSPLLGGLMGHNDYSKLYKTLERTEDGRKRLKERRHRHANTLATQLRHGKCVFARIFNLRGVHWVTVVVHVADCAVDFATNHIQILYYDSLGQSIRSATQVFDYLHQYLLSVIAIAWDISQGEDHDDDDDDVGVLWKGTGEHKVGDNYVPFSDFQSGTGDASLQITIYDTTRYRNPNDPSSKITDTDQSDATECGVWALLRVLYAAAQTPFVPIKVKSDEDRMRMRKKFFRE